MDLDTATAEGLDWAVVRDSLATAARTPMGSAAILAMQPFTENGSIEEMFDAIDELRALESRGTPLPVGAVTDARVEARRAARGEVLEPQTLIRAGTTLDALWQLSRILDRHASEVPTLARWGSGIQDDPEVRDELRRAFDPAGQLSATRWPILGELRQRISSFHDEIRGTLDRMVRGDEFADLLQDRFWTQRENRYVLPIKAHAKRMDHGIVHGTSASGQTVFVEPHQIIALNNRLRLAEGELKAEEWRILQQLSRLLGTVAPQVEAGVEAAIRIDLAAAREQLARSLKATRPKVGGDGVVALKQARHPVLVLRDVPVVANDIHLSPDRPALVISGPNAGGKTVALKAVGLCALLVRHGCWVPAGEGSRIDRFDAVRAVIGDQQTVEGDLSSFSAHLVALDAIVRDADTRVNDSMLVLLDELASGTDPTQGAAIGQAVLERLVDRGARVVVTTHYGPLKRLASTDPRFSVAAMQYLDGRPTYRVLAGITGESHAFGIAQRIGLDPAIIARATSLIGEGERSVSASLVELESERNRYQVAADEAEAIRKGLLDREAAVATKEADIVAKARKLEYDEARSFLQRVRQAEKAIQEIVDRLREDPSEKEAELAKKSVAAFRGIVPARPAPAEATAAPVEYAVGDKVRLREYDLVGEVMAVGDGGILVRTGAVTINTRIDQVEPARR